MCRFGSVLGSCGPRYYQPLSGAFYRNRGGGKFEDVTKAWGGADVSGKCLGVAVADYDSAGRPSLSLANDEMPGDLLRNTGNPKRRFENVAIVGRDRARCRRVGSRRHGDRLGGLRQ